MKHLAICILVVFPTFSGKLLASSGFLDLRSHIDVDNCCYYVEFYTRTTFPLSGHTFVRWKVVDRQTGRQASDCYGFYSALKWRGAFRPVLGELRNEGDAVNSYIITNSLIVQVDRMTFLRSRTLIPLWKNKSYFMFSRNCTHFAEDVAHSIGLEIPYCLRPLLPALHLENIKSANTQFGR